jgi:hypothetical protein
MSLDSFKSAVEGSAVFTSVHCRTNRDQGLLQLWATHYSRRPLRINTITIHAFDDTISDIVLGAIVTLRLKDSSLGEGIIPSAGRHFVERKAANRRRLRLNTAIVIASQTP